MWGISLPGRPGAGVKGGRRDACPTCLGRASGLEAGEPAVEGGRFSGAWRSAGRGWGELRTPEGERGRGSGTVWRSQPSPRGCGAEGVWDEKLGLGLGWLPGMGVAAGKCVGGGTLNHSGGLWEMRVRGRGLGWTCGWWQWGCLDLLPFNQVGWLILRLFPEALSTLLVVLVNLGGDHMMMFDLW